MADNVDFSALRRNNAPWTLLGNDMVLTGRDTAGAGTARLVNSSPTRAVLLRALTILAELDAGGRATGQITRLRAGGKDLMWSNVPGTGGFQTFPVEVFREDSGGLGDCNDARAIVDPALGVELAATLDAAGTTDFAFGIDSVPEGVVSANEKAQARGEIAFDPRWLFGLGTVTIAAGATGTISGVAMSDCDSLGRLFLSVVNTDVAFLQRQARVTSIRIAQQEQMGGRLQADNSMPAVVCSRDAFQRQGLYVIAPVKSSNVVAVDIVNDDGAPITVRGGFMRDPGQLAQLRKYVAQRPSAAALKG